MDWLSLAGNGDLPVDDLLLVLLELVGDVVDAIEDLRARFGSLPAAIITGEISAERLESLQASGLPVLQKPLQAPALGHLLCRLIRQAAARPA